jgi:heat shock protein 90kDa beta
MLSTSEDVKLMVKRTFITSDLGEDALPKWASWVKVVVDAEDLPLNVSRETLQSNKFLKQLRSIILKRLLQLFQKIAEEDGEKWEKVLETYSGALKLGAVEDTKNRDKLVSLCRFHTNTRNNTSLEQVCISFFSQTHLSNMQVIVSREQETGSKAGV